MINHIQEWFTELSRFPYIRTYKTQSSNFKVLELIQIEMKTHEIPNLGSLPLAGRKCAKAMNTNIKDAKLERKKRGVGRGSTNRIASERVLATAAFDATATVLEKAKKIGMQIIGSGW